MSVCALNVVTYDCPQQFDTISLISLHLAVHVMFVCVPLLCAGCCRKKSWGLIKTDLPIWDALLLGK